MGFEADDRGMGGRVFISTEGGEVLSSTENILTGLPNGMHLLQELCRENVKGGKRHFIYTKLKKIKPLQKITHIVMEVRSLKSSYIYCRNVV